jgi:hypothetical protein
MIGNFFGIILCVIILVITFLVIIISSKKVVRIISYALHGIGFLGVIWFSYRMHKNRMPQNNNNVLAIPPNDPDIGFDPVGIVPDLGVVSVRNDPAGVVREPSSIAPPRYSMIHPPGHSRTPSPSLLPPEYIYSDFDDEKSIPITVYTPLYRYRRNIPIVSRRLYPPRPLGENPDKIMEAIYYIYNNSYKNIAEIIGDFARAYPGEDYGLILEDFYSILDNNQYSFQIYYNKMFPAARTVTSISEYRDPEYRIKRTRPIDMDAIHDMEEYGIDDKILKIIYHTVINRSMNTSTIIDNFAAMYGLDDILRRLINDVKSAMLLVDTVTISNVYDLLFPNNGPI